MQNRILVTGALGHIGSRLIRELSTYTSVDFLYLVDNLKTQRFTSLFNLPAKNYAFFELDVSQHHLQEEILADVDLVIHLAAQTDATGSFEQAEEVERNNFFATKLVAEQCAIYRIPLIHLSSTSVYGDQSVTVDEDLPEENLAPQSPYAETKLNEERLLKTIEGLSFTSLRFGTIFGVSEGMRFHTAVNKFCWQASNNLPITIWSTAMDQKRPYLDLTDAVRAISHVIGHRLFNNQVFNVLTGNYTVRVIVEEIIKNVPSATFAICGPQDHESVIVRSVMRQVFKNWFHIQR